MRGAWLCVGVVLALLVGQPVAAQPLQRVGERLLQAAAPWCGSFSDLDVQGVRRCTLRIAALQMGGAGNAHAFFTASVVADRLVEQLDDAELALVLGHEVAHIVLGHMLAGLRAAGADARALDLVATLAPLPHAGTPTAPHTLELDADALGLVFAGLAGYPLAAAPRLWRERLPALGVATAASSSHPAAATRADALQRRAAAFCTALRSGSPVLPPETRLQPEAEYRRDEVLARQRSLASDQVCAGLPLL